MSIFAPSVRVTIDPAPLPNELMQQTRCPGNPVDIIVFRTPVASKRRGRLATGGAKRNPWSTTYQ